MNRNLPADPIPSTGSVPEPSIEVIRGGVVMPMRAGREMPCGVFRPDNSFCQQSRTLISARRLSGVPDLAPPHEIEHVEGRFLFAGVGRHHFGHFLMEGVGRLWALDQIKGSVDGILIVPMHGKDIEAVMRRRLLPFYRMLSDDLPLYLVERPALIDEVLLPSQGFGHLHWSAATLEFRHFVRKRIAAKITPEGPERLYISRTQLKSADQRMDQETLLEAILEEAGYTIFHPQQHSIEAQCAHYMAAREIIGADGSAFHLAPFAMRKGTRVGLIQRRHRQALFDALATQIRAFARVDLVTFNPLLSREQHGTDPGIPDMIDLIRLEAELRAARFL